MVRWDNRFSDSVGDSVCCERDTMIGARLIPASSKIFSPQKRANLKKYIFDGMVLGGCSDLEQMSNS